MAPRHLGKIAHQRHIIQVSHQTTPMIHKYAGYLWIILLIIFLFNAYKSEYITEYVRHAVTRAASPDDPSKSFVCLKNDAHLWDMRRNISIAHTHAICGSKPRIRFDIPIPILVVTWDGPSVPVWEFKRPTFHNMISTSLNTAAEFNDHVILLNMGSPNRHILHNRVKTIYGDSFLRNAMNSFNATLYRHHSPNAFIYELTRFQRWFAIAAFMQQKDMPRVFIMDVDVLLFTNVTMQIEQCFPDCRTVGYGCYSTYMTKEDVIDFTLFIVKYFERGEFHDELADFGIVSDMILYLRWQQINHVAKYCVADAFKGTFSPDFKQDILGIPYQKNNGARPLSLHFSLGYRKAILEYCKSYY